MIKRLKRLFCRHRALELRARSLSDKSERYEGRCMYCGQNLALKGYPQYYPTYYDFVLFVEAE